MGTASTLKTIESYRCVGRTSCSDYTTIVNGENWIFITGSRHGFLALVCDVACVNVDRLLSARGPSISGAN